MKKIVKIGLMISVLFFGIFFSKNDAYAGTTYEISYDANEGTWMFGVPATQFKTHGEDLCLSSVKPMRAGYDFLGWSITKGATSALYQPEEKYTKNETITLYAVWEANGNLFELMLGDMGIEYDANGGFGAPKREQFFSSMIMVGSNDLNKAYISTVQPTREGYVFKGWTTKGRNETVIEYQSGDKYYWPSMHHILYAVWEKIEPQTITAESKTVTYGSKDFNLNATSNGDGKLTYSSSNKKVATIDKNGKVKVKGCGKATITIKATATDKYEAAVKKITITVNPKQATLKSVTSPGKKKLSAVWKKDSSVTGYQVMFSTRKKFDRETYERPFKKSTTKFSVVGVKSGKKYYVKVRSYKTVNGTKYYGAWSKVKSVKIK